MVLTSDQTLLHVIMIGSSDVKPAIIKRVNDYNDARFSSCSPEAEEFLKTASLEEIE